MMENNSTADKNCEQIYENVGDVDNIDARKVKIVHISDTHLLHEQYVKDLPDGDILVHSGDFNKLSLLKLFTQRLNSTFLNAIETINDFFASVPHKYKIFVAGNHEISFVGRNRTLIREHLSNCIYLHNSSVRVMGVNFYGAPFTTYRFGSFADAFVQKPDELKHVWSAVPENTDVVVTHGPPQNILDLGQKSVKTNLFSSHYVLCDVCGNSHPDDIHYGCRYLKETIFNRVRPRAHLFGHTHETHNMIRQDGILFSNAAMPLHPVANVFNFYVHPSKYVDEQSIVSDYGS